MIPFFSTAKESPVQVVMSDSYPTQDYESQMPVDNGSVENQSELVISGRSESETAKLTKILRIARNLDEERSEEQSTTESTTFGAEITGISCMYDLSCVLARVDKGGFCLLLSNGCGKNNFDLLLE